MKISIVMGLNNRYVLSKHTLPNLARTAFIQKYEFIVVLDGKQDKREVALAQKLQKKGVIKKIIYRNRSTSEVDMALQGFEQAEGDYLIYLVNDLIFHNFFHKDWIKDYAKMLEDNPRVGTVTMYRKTPITALTGNWSRLGIKILKNEQVVYVIKTPSTRVMAIRKRDWDRAKPSFSRYQDGRWEVALGRALSRKGLLHIETADLSIGCLHIGMKGGYQFEDRRLWNLIKDRLPSLVRAYEKGIFCPPVHGLEVLF